MSSHTSSPKVGAYVLTEPEKKLVRAVCEVLEKDGSKLKARELVSRLRLANIEVEKRELNSILYRAQDSFPELMVSEGTGFWHYEQASKALQVEPVPTPFSPSKEQRFVIEAEANSWLLVEAGPGTGKTAVACARVAKLLGEGIAPSSILLVSFTRTAVAELRSRIRRMAQSVQGASGVRITTLDSEAWHLGFGFRGAAQGHVSGFDENIDGAIRLLKERAPEVMEWFESIRHIIIDEAQDLVGNRAELVFQLLDSLGASAGVTVFVDPAQAIYGFSTDVDDAEEGAKSVAPFHEQLLAEFPESFVEAKLTKLYRTSSIALQQVFEGGRRCVFGEADAGAKLDELEAMARSNSKATLGVDKRIDLGPHELVVFRRRSEVLMASSFLSANEVPHRLRLSQTALGVQPWVALVLSKHETTSPLTPEVFGTRWAALGSHPLIGGLDHEEVWSLLMRTAGLPTGSVDLMTLRKVLSRARPPAEFCQTEVGIAGPILGTIHASKGREADKVTLMLPRTRREGTDLEEEVRVTYVGATRARKELLVGEGYVARGLHGLGGAGGRLYSIDKRDQSAQVEIGRPNDVNVRSVIDKVATLSAERADAVQQYLAAYAGQSVPLTALHREGVGFSYFVGTDETKGGYLCQLDDHVNADLFSIGNEIDPSHGLKPPPMIPHLYLVGCRTVVLPPDDPQLSRLVEPWASRGIFLAPVIKGLVKVKMFHKRRGRSYS
jgi:hypothetical protein